MFTFADSFHQDYIADEAIMAAEESADNESGNGLFLEPEDRPHVALRYQGQTFCVFHFASVGQRNALRENVDLFNHKDNSDAFSLAVVSFDEQEVNLEMPDWWQDR